MTELLETLAGAATTLAALLGTGGFVAYIKARGERRQLESDAARISREADALAVGSWRDAIADQKARIDGLAAQVETLTVRVGTAEHRAIRAELELVLAARFVTDGHPPWTVPGWVTNELINRNQEAQ